MGHIIFIVQFNHPEEPGKLSRLQCRWILTRDQTIRGLHFEPKCSVKLFTLWYWLKYLKLASIIQLENFLNDWTTNVIHCSSVHWNVSECMCHLSCDSLSSQPQTWSLSLAWGDCLTSSSSNSNLTVKILVFWKFVFYGRWTQRTGGCLKKFDRSNCYRGCFST